MDDASAPARWNVRHVRVDEFDAWTKLFRGYADFYHWPTSDAHQQQIWRWIHEERTVECLVAVASDDDGGEAGELVGIAHLREWVRPLRGVTNGYLDDIYVAPDRRGSGIAGALFDEITLLAIKRDWDVVRWTTADDNYTARAVYDRVANRTTWITYDMDC